MLIALTQRHINELTVMAIISDYNAAHRRRWMCIHDKLVHLEKT
ncbi:MAG: hypothetical protein ACKOC5_12070 [Chloroflexota bacterium]